MTRLPTAVRERLSVVTDEIAADLGIAVEHAMAWGLDQVDVRGVGGLRVPDLDARGRAALSAVARIVRIRRLSPGLFKGGMAGPDVRRELEDVLPAALELAGRCSTGQIVVFGGGRGSSRSESLAVLREARDRCDAAGVELVVENSALCRVAVAEDLRDVADTLGVRVVWDPGNAAAAGTVDPALDSASIASVTAVVHLRDRGPRGWCRLDDGGLRWREGIRGLEDAGYRGDYVVESHLPGDPGATPWNVRVLGRHLADVLGVSAEDAPSTPAE